MKSKFSFLFTLAFLALSTSLAAVTVTVNGTNHSIPQTNEKGWGNNVTAWIQAISANTLQPSGGSFTLTADTDFGSSFGLKSIYLKSRATNPAGSGVLRLGNTESVGWRNAANSGNLLLTVNASDQLTFNGNPILGSSALTASRALQTDGSGLLSASSVTSTELGYLSGVTSAIQTQLNGKQASGTYIASLTGDVVAVGPGAASAAIQSGVITNSMVNASAAIARTKIASGTASHVLINDGSGVMSSEANLAISRGGTGQATKAAAFDALSPTSSEGDIEYRNASTNTNLAIGSQGQYLGVIGSGTSGKTVGWRSNIAPAVQRFTTSGAYTYNWTVAFIVSSASATAGATYTNNGVTFTVSNTIASGTLLYASGNGTPQQSGTLTKSTGTGDSTITFSAYRVPLYIEVVGIGAGGGGAGGGTTGAGSTGASTGGNTTFSTIMTASGGVGGLKWDIGSAGDGGAISITTSSTVIAVESGAGAGGGNGQPYAAAGTSGGHGGPSYLGSGSRGGTGGNAAVNASSPGGGGGGGSTGAVASSYSGGGGGAGGYGRMIIYSPSSQYTGSVGAKGAKGAAGGSGSAGGDGADGIVIVKEFYQ